MPVPSNLPAEYEKIEAPAAAVLATCVHSPLGTCSAEQLVKNLGFREPAPVMGVQKFLETGQSQRHAFPMASAGTPKHSSADLRLFAIRGCQERQMVNKETRPQPLRPSWTMRFAWFSASSAVSPRTTSRAVASSAPLSAAVIKSERNAC